MEKVMSHFVMPHSNDWNAKRILNNGKFSTYALLSNDGWFANGEMGWFGISCNEGMKWEDTFHQLISSIDENKVLTIVDCHI